MKNTTPSRRTFIKGASVATVAGLAGCSNQSGDGGSETSSEDGSGGTATDTASSSSDVTIKFWHAMGGDIAKLLEDMGSDFESQADGVTLDITSKGSYRDTLNATTSAVQAGNPPAVAQIFEIGTQLALDSGAFTPVEDIIPKDKIDYDNFLESVLSYYRIDGKLNSMPFNSSNAIFFYNKDAFAEAGLDPENPRRRSRE
ncbi:extracellular solute-binding protein [Haloarculaceae archaeon H-GB2-1]|nr:extracellular solute-binding protein [Haloarculaceae archaeon H-GB11]MEA5408091.1 extracellular solute-binding protein [Haloarculaceae archaeon H-GB2-1]